MLNILSCYNIPANTLTFDSLLSIILYYYGKCMKGKLITFVYISDILTMFLWNLQIKFIWKPCWKFPSAYYLKIWITFHLGVNTAVRVGFYLRSLSWVTFWFLGMVMVLFWFMHCGFQAGSRTGTLAWLWYGYIDVNPDSHNRLGLQPKVTC